MSRRVRLAARHRAKAVLLALVLGLGLAGRGARAAEAPTVIAITAKRFEFSPREIHLKLGETVKLALTAEDATHGFFARPLGIDELIVPGKTTEVVLTPRVAGRYTTICDHFCGSGHGGMKMTIVVD